MRRGGLFLAWNLLLVAALPFGVELLARRLELAPKLWRIDRYGADSEFVASDNPLLGYLRRPSLGGNNAEGFFDRPHAVERAHSQRSRTILLGDSVVEMEYAGSPENTIGGRLQRMLGEETEVISMGISGYCTRSEVELLRTFGLKYEPDLVILLFVENDFEDISDNIVDPMSDAGAKSDRPPLAETLFLESHAFRLAALRWNWFGLGGEQRPAERRAHHQKALGDDNVATGLHELSRLSRAHHFDVLVAIWPTFLDAAIVDRDRSDPADPIDAEPERPRRLTIEAYAAREGLRTKRLSPFFRTAWSGFHEEGRPPPRLAYTVGDSMHPNHQGAETGAAALASLLQELQIPRALKVASPSRSGQPR